jgi:hypothetical protein
MTTDTMTDAVQPQRGDLWDSIFDVSKSEDLHGYSSIILRSLQVERNDILTAKLPTTVNFYKAVEARTFPVLPNGIGDLGKVLGIFGVLGTFDNLARARFGDLTKPAFWVRNTPPRRGATPAIPVSEAARLCGIEPSLLRASLVPMVKDEAVEFIRSPSGVAAIMVMPGFINEHNFRKFYKV